MEDTGSFQVNVDEAVFSGKVSFQNKEHVLLLLPGLLICREFATEANGFSLKLDQITGCYQDKKKASEFHLTAIVPRSNSDRTLVNVTFDLKCAGEEEVLEWVDTLQSVVTDRNIRAIEAERTRVQQADSQIEGAFVELKSIFPDMDDDLIKSILIAKGGNLQRALDELLGMSDPNFKGDSVPPPRQASIATSTPQDQILLDEQLALALQDELFLEQINRDETFRRTLAPAHQAQDDFSITDKFQEMSDAAKKKFGELYFKFKKATIDKDQEQDIAGQEMMAMKKGADVPRDESQDHYSSDDEDVPLERPGNKLFGRSDGYQPLSASSSASTKEPSNSRPYVKSELTDDDL